MRQRCLWASDDPLMIAYHDEEWGVAVRDDEALYAKLVLDGAQAGLSWSTSLRKRDAYHRAFHDLDPARVARYGSRDIARLMADPTIVRNGQKIRRAIQNARAYLELRQEGGSFSDSSRLARPKRSGEAWPERLPERRHNPRLMRSLPSVATGTQDSVSTMTGCCVSGAGTAQLEIDCPGFNDSANVYVRVKGISSNACTPYDVSYHF